MKQASHAAPEPDLPIARPLPLVKPQRASQPRPLEFAIDTLAA